MGVALVVAIGIVGGDVSIEVEFSVADVVGGGEVLRSSARVHAAPGIKDRSRIKRVK